MAHIPFKIILLLISVFCIGSDAAGQQKYLFIEPNISFSYDSTKLKVETRYSNTVYKTESYDFILSTDTINRVRIHVMANNPLEKPISVEEVAKFMEEKLAMLEDARDSAVTVLEYDKKVRNVEGFLCTGVLLQDKKTGATYTSITCNHNSDADLTEIRLTSDNHKTLREDYELLALFLKGFATYTPEKIAKEEALIKARYKVKVKPTTAPNGGLKWPKSDFYAIVSTKQPLKHVVKSVNLYMGYAIIMFPPNERGEVYIDCSGTKKGVNRLKAELVLLNSFGKMVAIPFVVEFNTRSAE